MFAIALHALKIQTCGLAVSQRETVKGSVRVFAKTRDIPGNCEFRNLLTVQEPATPGNPVKYFEVLAGAISWGFKSPSPHHILKDLPVFV